MLQNGKKSLYLYATELETVAISALFFIVAKKAEREEI